MDRFPVLVTAGEDGTTATVLFSDATVAQLTLVLSPQADAGFVRVVEGGKTKTKGRGKADTARAAFSRLLADYQTQADANADEDDAVGDPAPEAGANAVNEMHVASVADNGTPSTASMLKAPAPVLDQQVAVAAPAAPLIPAAPVRGPAQPPVLRKAVKVARDTSTRALPTPPAQTRADADEVVVTPPRPVSRPNKAVRSVPSSGRRLTKPSAVSDKAAVLASRVATRTRDLSTVKKYALFGAALAVLATCSFFVVRGQTEVASLSDVPTTLNAPAAIASTSVPVLPFDPNGPKPAWAENPAQAAVVLAAVQKANQEIKENGKITPETLALMPPDVQHFLLNPTAQMTRANPAPGKNAPDATTVNLYTVSHSGPVSPVNDPNGIPDTPSPMSKVYLTGEVVVPMPGGGDLKTVSDFSKFGLKP